MCITTQNTAAILFDDTNIECIPYGRKCLRVINICNIASEKISLNLNSHT